MAQKNQILTYDPNAYLKTNDPNFVSILKDALAGNPEALQRKEIQALNVNNLKAAIQWLSNREDGVSQDIKTLLSAEGWRLTYFRKPPTPKEFLTYEWIGPQSESVWPNVEKAFLEYLDPNPLNPKRGLALSTSIGWGKSLLSNLCQSYLIVLFGLMRQPWKILGHSPMTVYHIALCSFTQTKAWDLLGAPFEQFLEQNPYFEKVGRHDDISAINKEDVECKKCYYTTAARGSSKMLFRNNLNMSIVSTEGGLLGKTIVSCVMSELSWWRKNGWTNEDIFTFFTKAKQRVDSRMNGHYLGRYVIDSSPFSFESPIDSWIWEKAKYDPSWYCVLGARWDYFKEEFPNFFDKEGKEIHSFDSAFQVYKGGKSEPPKACLSENEASIFDPLDLVWCPREQINSKGTLNFAELALQSPVEFLRDYAGIPAGASDRIFQTVKIVDDIFDNDLKNIYTSIIASSSEEPEHLLWTAVRDKFFINFNNNYMFYREPNVKRAIAVDQSLSGDVTGISIAHSEFVKTGNGDIVTVIVVDMTLVIIPKGGQINLEAIKFFIMDLIERGNMNIARVSFDTFQSASTKQYLARKKVPLDYISVDKDNEHYATFVDMVMHNRVFCGKNIFFKNNLRSLHIAQRESGSIKYDHFKGKLINESEDTNWETSQLGTNAKDVADAVCACTALINKYDIDFAPTHEWIPKRSEDEIKQATVKRLGDMGLSF